MSSRPRPSIRLRVSLDLNAAVADAARRRAHRRGLSLPEYVERLLRADLARDTAERTILRPIRPPIAMVPWTWFRRRTEHLLALVDRTRRPVIVRGKPSSGITPADLRGRDPRSPKPLGIRDGLVVLPVRSGLRRRLGRCRDAKAG